MQKVPNKVIFSSTVAFLRFVILYSRKVGASKSLAFFNANFRRYNMLFYAISAESSGPFPVAGRNNKDTELTALRIVTCPDNKLICDGVFTRSDGLSVASPFNSITDEMVKGRPDFSKSVDKLAPVFFHKGKNEKGVVDYDTLFFCFGAGFYQELFKRYGVVRDKLFVDVLPMVRDIRDQQARVNMPSNAAGSKMPTIKEVAEFFGKDEPRSPQDKTELICDVWNWVLESRGRGGI